VDKLWSNFMEEKQKRHLITRPIVHKILKENLPPFGLENYQQQLQEPMEWKPGRPNAEADKSDE